MIESEIISCHPSRFADVDYLMSVDPWKCDARITNQPICQFDYLPTSGKRLWKMYRAHILLDKPANRIRMEDGTIWWRSHRHGVNYFETGPTTRRLKHPMLQRDVKWEGPLQEKIQWTEEPFIIDKP